MNTIYIQEYKSSFGELIIGDFEGKICLCDWKYRKQRQQIDDRIKKYLLAEFKFKSTPEIENTILQLEEYTNGKRTFFNLPLLLIGTEFQKTVWNALQNIPFGVTMSYLQLSQKLNNTGAIRAVASANGANAISIIIPCHRIIGSNGDLVGYAGGLAAKKKILALENNSQLELDFN